MKARLAFVAAPVVAVLLIGGLVWLLQETGQPGGASDAGLNKGGGPGPTTTAAPGPVTVRISGSVVSLATSEPVAGARVWVEEPDAPLGATPMAEAVTDLEGRFVIPGVPPGEYHVFAAAANHAYDRATVMLQAGLPATVTLALAAGTHVSGHVIDSEGAPLAGVSIVVTPRLRPETGISVTEVVADAGAAAGPDAGVVEVLVDLDPDAPKPRALFALSADDGTFQVNGLPHGRRWELLAHRDGFEDVLYPDLTPPVDELMVELNSLGRVYGSVFDGLTGAPIPFARVLVGGSGVWPPREVKADATGTYHVIGLPEGVYVFQAFGDGEDGTPRASPPLEGVGIGRAAEPRNVDIAVEPAMTVVGRVVAPDGSGVEGARIRLATDTLSTLSLVTETDVTGAYVFSAVFPDDYTLDVWAPWLQPILGRWLLVPPPADRGLWEEAPDDPSGTTPAGEDAGEANPDPPDLFVVDIPLGAGLSADGSVVDADGSPVASARLEVEGVDLAGMPFSLSADSLRARDATWRARFPAARDHFPMPVLMTDGSGQALLTALPAGELRVTARAPGYAPGRSAPLRLVAGTALARFEIRLVAEARISGRVRDDSGVPVGGVAVQALLPGEAAGRATVTAGDGTFELGGLAGEVTLVARKRGYIPAESAMGALLPGTAPEVELVLAPSPGALRGRVLDERGFPIAGAEVSALGRRGARTIRGRSLTDAWGEFAIIDLDAGPFDVSASHPEYAPTELTGVFPDGGLEILLGSGATLSGTVVDVDSDLGVDFFTVELRTGPGHAPRRRAFTDGSFRWERLAPGRYQLRITASMYAATEMDITLSGDDDSLAVLMGRSGAIAGEVREAPSGWPIPGVRVTAHAVSEDGTVASIPSGSSRTGDEGGFRIGSLPAGTYVVATWKPTHADAVSDAVLVEAGETTDFVHIATPVRDGEITSPAPAGTTRATVALAIALDDDSFRITAVTAGSSAAEAGLAPGDYLMAVDDHALEGEGLAEARRRLAGPTGSTAVLMFYRPEDDEVYEVRVSRDR